MMWRPKNDQRQTKESRVDGRTKSIHQQPYPTGKRFQEMLCGHIDQQLQNGEVLSAQLENVILIVLVSEKDGTLQVCVFCRRHDAATVPDTYALRRMKDLIDSEGENSMITAVDPLRKY